MYVYYVYPAALYIYIFFTENVDNQKEKSNIKKNKQNKTSNIIS
jgi:hypothetical protein